MFLLTVNLEIESAKLDWFWCPIGKPFSGRAKIDPAATSSVETGNRNRKVRGKYVKI